MKSTDKRDLAEILGQVYEVNGKTMTEASVKLWFNILEPYELEDVRAALGQLMRTSEYLPKPAAVIDILEPSQWPTPAEAWATYPHSEQDTAAVCEETLAAWASAEGLYESGDAIGARRAFEGAYTRHMDEAKRKGRRKPAWMLSVGWDAQKREAGALDAVKRGLLPHKACERYLTGETRKALRDDSGDRAGDVRHVSRLLGRPDGGGAG